MPYLLFLVSLQRATSGAANMLSIELFFTLISQTLVSVFCRSVYIIVVIINCSFCELQFYLLASYKTGRQNLLALGERFGRVQSDCFMSRSKPLCDGPIRRSRGCVLWGRRVTLYMAHLRRYPEFFGFTSPSLHNKQTNGSSVLGLVFPPRSPRPTSVPSLRRSTHGEDYRVWLVWQRGGGGHSRSRVRRQEDPRLFPGPETDAARRHRESGDGVRTRVSADEHPPPPAHRLVFGRVFPTRLADAGAGHGEAGDQSPRHSGSRA